MERKIRSQDGSPAFGTFTFALLLGASMSCGAACSDGGTTEPKEKTAHAVVDAGKDAAIQADAAILADSGAAPSGQSLQLSMLAQIGVAVQDAAAASDAFTRMLGIGPWTIVEQKGKNAEGSPFVARVAYAYVGALEIELVEVTSGTTPQTQFLRDHGEGLYDLGFFVDDVDADVARLTGRGATVLLQEPGEWAYIDSPDAGGVIFKLVKTREKRPVDETGFEPPQDTLRPVKLDHVGAWAVDARAVTAQWESAFGIGSWNIFPYTVTPDMGDPLEATLAFTAALGPTQVELVQPTQGTVPAELRRGDGRGLWEIAIAVTDPDAETAQLVDLGARVIVQATGTTSVVDIGAGGVAIELFVPGA